MNERFYYFCSKYSVYYAPIESVPYTLRAFLII